MHPNVGPANARRAAMMAQPKHEDARVMVAMCAACRYSNPYKEFLLSEKSTGHPICIWVCDKCTRQIFNFFPFNIYFSF
jgi:hypothetical protein